MSISSQLRQNFAHPVILLLLTLILVPMIFLPFGIDQCIFIRASEVLFSGGKLYADYFEQKPPLLFLLYGIGRILFGNNDSSYRFFDFLWQLFTVFSLLYCIQRLTRSQATGIIAAAVYGILYCSMGHSETMECESFIAPAVIWLLYLTCRNDSSSIRILLFRGLLSGFCFGLKFTFGVVFATLFIGEIVSTNKNLLKRTSLMTVGFVVAALCSLWALFDPEIFHGYMRVLEYTRAYAANPPFNLEFTRNALMQIGRFFGDNISLSVTLAAAFGAGFSVRYFSSDANNPVGQLSRTSILLFFALLLSIIIERKFNPYHFLRLFIPLSVLASLGIPATIAYFQKHWKTIVFSWKVIIVFLGLSILLMSPLPRCIKNTKAAYLFFASEDAYWASFQKPDDPALIMVDTRNIASYIRSSPNKGRTFAIATAASYLYRQLDEHPISKFSMPMYYYATIIPKGAYQEMFEEVKQAHWLVAQKNDVHPILYGHTKSSWECVRQDSVMFTYLNQNFTKTKEIGAFYIFERKE
jgi:4-amino-4-deoxy-L-arabinose transferase-like glycosyltransferase